MSHSLSNQQLLAAANSFGTPLYVYDAANIEAQYTALTTAFTGQDVKFFYASTHQHIGVFVVAPSRFDDVCELTC